MKKKTKKKSKRQKHPLFYVSKKKSTVAVKDGDKINVQILCPMCKTYWADADVVFGGNITSESFRLREPYLGSFMVKAGKPLTCPACFFKYTNWAVMACVLASMNKQDVSKTVDSGFRSFGGGQL